MCHFHSYRYITCAHHGTLISYCNAARHACLGQLIHHSLMFPWDVRCPQCIGPSDIAECKAEMANQMRVSRVYT